MSAQTASPLFSSPVEEVLFVAAIVVGFAVPFAYFVRWTRQNAPSTRAKPRTDFSFITNLAIVPLAVVAVAIGYARIGALPHWLFYPGLTMFVSGLALTVWAYHTLGRFFSLEVQVQGDHRVVDGGPYRILRHPGYAGVVFGFIGLGLAVQSWVSVLVLVLGCTSALVYRAWVEEGFLAAELGDEYRKYMARTKRLVPYIW